MFLAKASTSTTSLDLSDLLGSSSSTTSTSDGAFIWSIIAIVLSIVGGILVYTMFLTKKNDGKFKGFVGWLYDFLKFKTLTIEIILKVLYLIAAIAITLLAFNYFGTSAWWMFFVQIILGNVALRVGYELVLITILMWRNTEDIKKSLKK